MTKKPTNPIRRKPIPTAWQILRYSATKKKKKKDELEIWKMRRKKKKKKKVQTFSVGLLALVEEPRALVKELLGVLDDIHSFFFLR